MLSKRGFEVSTHCHGWDYKTVSGYGCRRDLNHPPTAVGGVSGSLCKATHEGFAQKVLNPTHGSGWFIQMLSTRKLLSGVEIPPTAVGGSFKYFLREDLKYPPTAVGGITKRFRGMSVEGT